jgi:hypothetical protein
LAIKYLDAKRIRALSTDTLPTNVPTNTIVEQTDNYSYRWFDGTDWIPIIPVPETISSLYAWYDADDITTITKNGSNRVERWANKEGTTSRDLVQTTASYKPLYSANVQNGKAVLDFDVNQPSMIHTASAQTALTMPITIIFVGKIPSNSASGQHFGWAEHGGSPNMEKSNVSDKLQVHWGNYIAYTSASSYVGQYTDITFIANSGSSDFRFNNVSRATGTASGDFQALELGVYGGATSSNTSWREDICEVIIYDKALSSSELTSMHTYLADKWDL